MAIAAGLSATKTGFELIKGAVELLKRGSVDVHEIQARLIELQGLMLEACSALVDAEEENRRLKRTLEEQNNLTALTEDMEFQLDGGFYVRRSEAEKGLIAYCPLCWQKDHLTVPLEASGKPGSFRCSIHETFYETAEHREAARRFAESRPRRGNWRALSEE
jgi:hypothetical protein